MTTWRITRRLAHRWVGVVGTRGTVWRPLCHPRSWVGKLPALAPASARCCEACVALTNGGSP